MNKRINNIQKNKKLKKQYLFLACSGIFVVLSAIFCAIITAWSVTFSKQKDFYINGEKVYGTVTGYRRPGLTIPYRVDLIVEYQSEDGTKYKLFEYADKYKYVRDEQIAVIEQEIGKQIPMIIDGKGKCMTASRDVSDYNYSIGWCIAGAVICGTILLANLIWLGFTIKKIVILNRNN